MIPLRLQYPRLLVTYLPIAFPQRDDPDHPGPCGIPIPLTLLRYAIQVCGAVNAPFDCALVMLDALLILHEAG